MDSDMELSLNTPYNRLLAIKKNLLVYYISLLNNLLDDHLQIGASINNVLTSIAKYGFIPKPRRSPAALTGEAASCGADSAGQVDEAAGGPTDDDTEMVLSPILQQDLEEYKILIQSLMQQQQEIEEEMVRQKDYAFQSITDINKKLNKKH